MNNSVNIYRREKK